MTKLFGPRARALGWQSRAADSDDDRELRPLVMRIAAIAGEDARLQKEAQKLAQAWLADRKGIDPSMVETVLRSRPPRRPGAVRSAGGGDAGERDRNERVRLVQALGEFDDVDICRAALDLIATGASISATRAGR